MPKSKNLHKLILKHKLAEIVLSQWGDAFKHLSVGFFVF